MNNLLFYASGLAIGLGAGAISFVSGYAVGRIRARRPQHLPHYRGWLSAPELTGDAAARLAVEGDDFDPDVPAKWPVGPWMA